MPRRRMRSGFFLVLWLMAWAAGASAQPTVAAVSEAVLQQVADSPFLKENVRVLCDEIGGVHGRYAGHEAGGGVGRRGFPRSRC